MPRSTSGIVPESSPSSTPSASVVAVADRSWRYWLGGLAFLAVAAGWAFTRRRGRGGGQATGGRAPASVAAESPPPPSPPATVPSRARLTLALRPRRAGINLLSATSENEVVVTNDGTETARDIRVQLRLMSASADQDAELAAYRTEPIVRPAVAPFALAPGESHAFVAVAALPREAIRPLTAAGRPMFVPIVAVNIVYVTAGVAGQLAQAFAIGVERVDSPKLAPIWLDVPARNYDEVAARPHAISVER